MSKNATLEIVSINQIEISKTNPRKSFDEKALAELSQSIKEHGILQPILVRPSNDPEEGFEQFELVCGERRYRAATMAGIEEIPVNIRVLTDDEAFELQIIENLERKDVHPMDEADAFKKMIDSGKYTITDVASKMVKSETFITQRLKLVDLIDSVRADFIAGHLGIGHAILIARCDEFKQLDIYEDAQSKDQDPHYSTIKDLKETIEDDTYLLAEAKFSLSDTKLNDTCACNICPKRSGANPVLFADMQDDRCFDTKCFDSKNEAFIEQVVARIINEGDSVEIISGYGKISELVESMCKQYGIDILQQYNGYSLYEANNALQTKGFYVSGHNAGKTIDIWKYIKKDVVVTTNEDTTEGKTVLSAEEIEIKESIEKVESRADRAKELDGEKIWAKIREINTDEIKTIIGGLFEVEMDALCLAMISKLGYYGNGEVKKIVGEFKLDVIQERHFTKFEFNQIARIFFLECLPNGYGDYYSSVNNYAYTKALTHYHAKDIQKLIDEQKAISDVRMDKADAKIKELKAKLSQLKPIEETPSEEPIEEVALTAKEIKANAKKATKNS